MVRGPLVWTVRPERMPQPWAVQLFGVPFDRVEHAPPWAEVQDQVAEALTGRTLVAYDLPRTYRLLQWHLPDWVPPRTVDIYILALLAWPELHLLDLPHLLARAGLDPGYAADRSPAGEAKATALILLAAVKSGALPPEYLSGNQSP